MPELPYAVEEAVSRLRVNIRFCGKDTRKILVTSSVPNEGKSFITMQLWRMLAESGFPTVMVDLDLRKSVLKSRHEMKRDDAGPGGNAAGGGDTAQDSGSSVQNNDVSAQSTSDSGELVGLDFYLSGQASYEDVVYETNIENGYIVPCTTLLENPSALMDGGALKELLGSLAQDYRFVLVDTPPLVSVADGALVAEHCDGALLVVRSRFASKSLVRQSMQQLDRVNCRLLGVVLNRVDTQARAYGRYYGYGYGYGYRKYGQDGYYGYGYGRKGGEGAESGGFSVRKIINGAKQLVGKE